MKTELVKKITLLPLLSQAIASAGENPLCETIEVPGSENIWQNRHQDQIADPKNLVPLQLKDIQWTYIPSPGNLKWYLKKEKGIAFKLGKTDRIDLDTLSPKKKKINLTRVYGEFISGRDGILRMGISADWWWEVYANGQYVYDAMGEGNGRNEFVPADHAFYIPVRKGRNLIAIHHSRGLASRMFAVQVLPAEKRKPAPVEAITDLHVALQKNKAGKQSFMDIQSAYDKIIQMQKTAKKNARYRILVHGGRYELKSPLHFSAKVPVEIRPFENEKVVISGGTILKKWERTKINGKVCFRTKLPAGVKELPFLYVNGKTAEPARWPKKGFLIPENYPKGEEPYDSFYIKKGDFSSKWYDPGNIGVRMSHLWIEENLRLESVQKQENKLKTACKILYKASTKSKYFFFNVREALTGKNEYYYDRKAGEIYYIPEKLNEPFEAVIPMRGVLLQADSGVKGLTLRGLTFAHGGNYIPKQVDGVDMRESTLPDITYPLSRNKSAEEKPFIAPANLQKETSVQKPSYASWQASTQLPGVLMFDNAEDCAVLDCEIRECAWYGIRVQTSSTNLRFEGNTIHEMGGGGIYICGMPCNKLQKTPSLEVNRVVMQKNHIYNCGTFFYSAVGILVKNACGCLIQLNHIHDLYYSEISVGWVWGYADSATHDIRVRRNYVHDIGKGILSDLAGIYFLGRQPGSRIYENVVHSVTCGNYGGYGIYPDEGSSHIVVERNIAFRCSNCGFYQHYGSENIIRNNVFAFNDEFGAMVSKDSLLGAQVYPGEFHQYSMSLINNVFYQNKVAAISISDSRLFRDHKLYSESNIFYDPVQKINFKAARTDLTFPEWQSSGLDRLSVYADPGFVNPEKGNFRLKKDSILWKYGFGFLNDILKEDFSL